MKKIITLFLMLSIVVSCTNNNKGDLLSKFSKIEKIYHSPIEVDEDSYFSRVFKMMYADNKIIAYDFDDKYVFSLTDLEKKSMLAKFGAIGQGPKEIIGIPSSVSLINKNTIGFF